MKSTRDTHSSLLSEHGPKVNKFGEKKISDGYVKTKFDRSSLRPSIRKISRILELVHTHLWACYTSDKQWLPIRYDDAR